MQSGASTRHDFQLDMGSLFSWSPICNLVLPLKQDILARASDCEGAQSAVW